MSSSRKRGNVGKLTPIKRSRRVNDTSLNAFKNRWNQMITPYLYKSKQESTFMSFLKLSEIYSASDAVSEYLYFLWVKDIFTWEENIYCLPWKLDSLLQIILRSPHIYSAFWLGSVWMDGFNIALQPSAEKVNRMINFMRHYEREIGNISLFTIAMIEDDYYRRTGEHLVDEDEN